MIAMIKKSVLLCICLTTALGMFAKGYESRQLMDFGWLFIHDGKSVNVDLPHDWDIHLGPISGKGATGTGGGWYPGGFGEYRKTFATPEGEVVKLHFEGVYQRAEVFVNGRKAGQHAYGYTPFTVDITRFLHQGNKEKNEVVVKVDNSAQPNCRWYSGSGIYRHVWLLSMPKVHIAENGIFVTTPEVSAEKAKVNVEVEVENESDTDQQAMVEVAGCDGQQISLKGGEHKTVSFSYTIARPSLWSPETPHLYTLDVSLNGRKSEPVHFGVRSFSFDSEKGFVLNGKKMLINGACVHHDDGVLGAMAFDAAEIRKVRLMKEAGFNLIRTSHNPSTRAFLDACDSLGILVIDEAFDGWRTAKTTFDYSTVIDSCFRDDIHAMVLRDRNHPSVIFWSIGNEVIERKDIRVITTARQLKQAILEKDTTRPVTEALCSWDSDWEIYDPHAEVLDIVGYNYMIFKHESDHKRDPRRVMWQTESYPRDAFQNWAVTTEHPYVVGDIVWTGLDYLGESGIGRYYYKGEREGEHYVAGGQPEWHGAYCGDVDITGWRKPISHYREMLWNDTQGLYMAVKEPNGYHGEIRETQWSVWPTWESWNWKGWEGKPVEVEVYTKQSEVSLFLDDQLIEKKSVGRDTQFKAVFTLPYQPGTLRAEAGGQRVSLSTAGDPARLRLTTDRRTITADGQDLAFVTIEVVDNEGRVCPEAAIPCEVTANGHCRLLAAANADLQDTEPYPTSHVTTWKGRAIIVVRSTMEAGQAKVSVKSKLPIAQIHISTKTLR